MAHECPECGSACHCGGDIDDLLLNVESHVIACNHCPPEYDYEEHDDAEMMDDLYSVDENDYHDEEA